MVEEQAEAPDGNAESAQADPVDQAWRDAIEEHCDHFLGPCPNVVSEQASDVVRIDLDPYLPAHNRDRTTLLTVGVSTKPTGAPDAMATYRHIELFTYLPSNWSYGPDEAHWWPCRMLKDVGRLVHRLETWYAPGQLLGGDPEEALTDESLLTGVVLLPPVYEDPAFDQLEIDGKTCKFLWAFPLTTPEVEYAQDRGVSRLLELMAERDVELPLDSRRACMVTGKKYGDADAPTSGGTPESHAQHSSHPSDPSAPHSQPALPSEPAPAGPPAGQPPQQRPSQPQGPPPHGHPPQAPPPQRHPAQGPRPQGQPPQGPPQQRPPGPQPQGPYGPPAQPQRPYPQPYGPPPGGGYGPPQPYGPSRPGYGPSPQQPPPGPRPGGPQYGPPPQRQPGPGYGPPQHGYGPPPQGPPPQGPPGYGPPQYRQPQRPQGPGYGPPPQQRPPGPHHGPPGQAPYGGPPPQQPQPGPPQQQPQGPDPQAADLWNKILAGVEQRLNRLLQTDGFLVVEEAISGYYVMLASNRDRGTLVCEAVSNQFLPSGKRLAPDQEQRMRALGWSPPGQGEASGTWNYARTLHVPIKVPGVARVAIATLRDIYACDPRKLSYTGNPTAIADINEPFSPG